jgi:hypothetical protein
VRGCLVAFLVLALLCAGGALFLGRGAAVALERALTAALGVSAEVGSAGISPFSGTYGLEGVRVANPPGFSAPHALLLERVTLHGRLGAFFADVVELDLLEIERLDLELEWRGGHTNYGVLLDHLRRLDSEDPSQRLPSPPEPTEDERGFVIRRVVLRDVSVRYRLVPGVKSEPLAIEELELADVGSATAPLDLARVNAHLFEALLAKALERGLEKELFPADLGRELEAALGALAEGGQGLREAAEAGLEDALKRELGDLLQARDRDGQ